MSRAVRLKLEFSQKSLLENMQQMYIMLSEKIIRCNRQIAMLTNMIQNTSDAITLQNVMANVEKMIATCQAQRLELIKIQKDTMTALKKDEKKKLEKEDVNNQEDLIKMQRAYADMKKRVKEQTDESDI